MTMQTIKVNSTPALKCFCLRPSTIGEIPAARLNFKMISLDRSHVGVFGGLGIEVYNDFKVFDASQNKWKHELFENEDIGYVPEKRFGHTLNVWGSQLIVVGGAGAIVPRMKSRKSYSDLRIMDLCKGYILSKTLQSLNCGWNVILRKRAQTGSKE